MIKNTQEITRQKITKGLNTYKNFFNLSEEQTPDSINVTFNKDGSYGKRLGSSTMNTVALESTGGYGMYDFGVLGIGGNDNNTKLLLHFNGADSSQTITDSSTQANVVTAVGTGVFIDTAKSKFGGASCAFHPIMTEMDYMEYSTNAAAQVAYVTNAVSVGTVSNTSAPVGFDFSWSAGNDAFAQGFKISSLGEITKFTVRLKYQTSISGTLTGYIYADSSGKPDALLATFSSMAATDLTLNYANYDFTGSFIPAVGTQYHLVVIWTNGTAGNTIYSAADNTNPYADGYWNLRTSGLWTSSTGWDAYFSISHLPLQCYSATTIKSQGSYSLKAVASLTDSLNKTLTRTVTPTIDLSNINTIKFDIYASRTGANIKIGIHDSGGVTTETTYAVISANTWETVTWDISAVANANKDAIDSIIITVVNASADNTFYIDNFYGISTFLNESKSYLTTPDSDSWNLGAKNFTIDKWINFYSVSTSQVFLGQGSNATNYWLWKWNTAATNTINGLYFQCYSAGVLIVNVTGAWAPNTATWYHLELVRNNTSNWYMFVGGSSLSASGTTTGIIPDFVSLLKIGVNVVTTNNNYLNAWIDELRLSHTARHTVDFTPQSVEYNSNILQERRLLCASGTGIYYSTDIGKTWAVVQTNRTAAINYFGFIKDYIINTNESYDPPQYWAGTAAQYFANISTAAPACKHSASHQGYALLLNESANKTGFYYVDQNSMFNSAWSNFKLPTGRNDELTAGFTIGRSLYVSSKYKLFRLNYIGGNPDWEYVEIKNWGFVPKTVKKVNLPNIGEAVIGLDWTKKIRIFFGSDDEVLSDHIAEDNGVTSFYLNNLSAVDLSKCWAEDDKKMQIYRLFLCYGGSSTVSYSINFDYRSGSWYPEDERPYQSGVIASDTADNQYMLGCNYNGRVVVMDSGNTEAGISINDHYVSSFFYSQSPARVFKNQQINLYFAVNSSGTLNYEDRSQFSNIWNLRQTITLANAISAIQIRHTVDIPESMNVYQFKLSSSANTAEPWRCNLMDLSLNDSGGIGIS